MLRLLLLLALGGCSGQNSNEGMQFVLMYMQNIVDYPQSRPVELLITNIGSGMASVSVNIPGCMSATSMRMHTDCLSDYSASVAALTSVRLILCSQLRHTYVDGSVAPKAVIVNSTNPIRLFGYNSDSYSADAFIVTRAQDLGRAHVISSYSPANIATQFGIVAQTDVNVYIAISSSRSDNQVVDYDGYRYTNGDHFRFMLPSGSSFLAYSVTDLSGVVVQADGPIAVFSGNVRTYVDGQRRSRDHLVEQLIPAAQLGRQYVFIPTPRATHDDVVRFIARLPSTSVTLITGNSTTAFTLQNAGDIVQMALTDVTHITSNSFLSVAVIVRSQEGEAAASSDPADPSLYFLPALNQYIPALSITPVFIYSITNGNFNKSYLLISIAKGQEVGLRFDNAAVTGVNWQQPTHVSALRYVAGVIPIDPTTSHVISHISPAARISVVLYSASDRESAATLLGIYYDYSQCSETTQISGDGIDNDCDGKIDEEIVNGLDDDGDLLTDEDCKVGAAVSFGTEYAVVFMSNDIKDSANVITQLELYVTPVNHDVNVTVTSLQTLSDNTTISILKPAALNDVTQIKIDSSMRLGFESDFGFSRKTQKGLYVKATDDIVLYGINKRTFSTDGFICFPFASAGKTYYAVTGYPINNGDDQCQIAIVAHVDNANDIVISIKENVHLNINGQIYTGPTQFTLPSINRLEAWELQSNDDLTGTKIESASGKRFSVFSGNVRHRVTLTQTSRDHIVEQMPPKATLGTTFSSIASPRYFNVGDYWKIVASESNTTVNYWYVLLNDTNSRVTGTLFFVKETDFKVIDPGVAVAIHIEADQAILVTQIVKSAVDYTKEMTDPALILIPPLQQWGSNYLFATPKSGQLRNDSNYQQYQLPYTNYIFLVIDKSVRSGISIVYPNGTVINVGTRGSWFSVPGSSHEAIVWSVADGQNKIVHSNSSAVYMGIMFGVQDRESYGQAVGLRLGTMCHTTISTMVLGDLIDNDCDGAIDEELLDMLDNDGDGLVDEDCYKVPDLGIVYVVVYEENDVEYPRFYPLELYLGNDNAGDAYCRLVSNAITSPRYDVTVKIAQTDVKTFAFSPSLRVTSSRKSHNSFTVYCSSQVTVFAINKETWSSDGFIAYPLSSLGRTYYSVSYSPQELSSQLAIVAVEGGLTTVYIRISDTANLIVSGANYTGGQSFNISLNKYEVFQAQSSGDLTASYIVANQKVAVFSGDVRTHVQLSKSRDHIVYQLPPTDSWGTVFNLVPNPGRTVGDVYRFISRDDGNQLTLCCNTSAPPQQYTLGQGKWMELSLSSSAFCSLTSTKPALVARIMKSQNGASSSELSDPCLTLVVPVSQYGHRATLLTPLYTGGKSAVRFDYTNYLTIIVPSGQQYGILVNGNPAANVNQNLSPVQWTQVGCSNFVAGTIMLDSRVRHFQITHTNTAIAFSGHLAGAADRESYCISLAQELPDVV